MLLGLCLILVPVHTQFAAFGWMFRYEAYLIWLMVLVSVMSGVALLRQGSTTFVGKRAFHVSLGLAALLLAAGLLYRSAAAFVVTPIGSQNIHQQQFQVARFLHKYYEGQCVAANDIGAITYLADVRLLDVYGLDGTQVAKLKLNKTFNARALADLAQQNRARIAVVYEDWMDEFGGMPSTWVKVANWRIPDNRVCSRDTVSFYAIDPAEIEVLAARLKEFSTQLPQAVVQTVVPAAAP